MGKGTAVRVIPSLNTILIDSGFSKNFSALSIYGSSEDIGLLYFLTIIVVVIKQLYGRGRYKYAQIQEHAKKQHAEYYQRDVDEKHGFCSR